MTTCERPLTPLALAQISGYMQVREKVSTLPLTRSHCVAEELKKTDCVFRRMWGAQCRAGKNARASASKWSKLFASTILFKRGCKSAWAQIVKADVPEKLTLSDYTDLAHACNLFSRTAIPRRTLGFRLMMCCVLSCVAVSLGGCCIFTPAAATCFVTNFT